MVIQAPAAWPPNQAPAYAAMVAAEATAATCDARENALLMKKVSAYEGNP